MENKTLMRMTRLLVSEEICRRAGRPIDHKFLDEIAEAKTLLQHMRGDEVLAGVVAVANSSLPLQIDISAPVGRDEERSPGRQTGFQEKRIFHTRKSGGQP